MNIPKILFAVSGIFTAAMIVKVGRDIDKRPDPRVVKHEEMEFSKNIEKYEKMYQDSITNKTE